MKTNTETKKRDPKAILADLAAAVMEYNALRDDEWDFQDENGSPDFWDDEISDKHEELINEILASRTKVRNLLVEATGDETISF